MIQFEDVSKSFGLKVVLDHMSLRVERGQTHVLLGRSGSGKSTVLRILMGLEKLETGRVSVDSHALGSQSQSEWVRRIGYVPQSGSLFPHLTVYENVTLVARALGWSDEKIESRWRETTPLVSLHLELTDRYPIEISGGEEQRVAILRALFLDPDVLIFDEPLSALDPLVRGELQTELKSLFSRLRKTVLIVTHDLEEAAYLGNEISLLDQGRLLQTGTFEELRDAPVDPHVTNFLRSHRSHLVRIES